MKRFLSIIILLFGAGMTLYNIYLLGIGKFDIFLAGSIIFTVIGLFFLLLGIFFNVKLSRTKKQVQEQKEALQPVIHVINPIKSVNSNVKTHITNAAFMNKKKNGTIRHIVCLCYDAPYINSLKPQLQNFIINAEQGRGSVITPTSRITFDSFYDNGSLEKPDMIRQKLEQIYCQVYRQSAMYELVDKTVAREVQQKDGHTLVKYFVLYE